MKTSVSGVFEAAVVVTLPAWRCHDHSLSSIGTVCAVFAVECSNIYASTAGH